MKAIYKITNLVNGRIYIGQSTNPKLRFNQHCTRNENSLIGKAISKYGKENFSFEILGNFEDYNEKEIEFIEIYNSLAPNGYNIHPGGNDPPHYNGEENPASKISNEIAKQIQLELLNPNIQRKHIKHKYGISEDILRHINSGESWYDDELKYPLRPYESNLNNERANVVIDLLLNTTLSQRAIGERVGWGRSAITMINNGINHRKEYLQYPLRKGRHYSCID